MLVMTVATMKQPISFFCSWIFSCFDVVTTLAIAKHFEKNSNL
jgi:hypothetical protein